MIPALFEETHSSHLKDHRKVRVPVYFSSMTLDGLYNSIVLCLLVALGDVAEASNDSEMGSVTRQRNQSTIERG
jgi:hypothetical protein